MSQQMTQEQERIAQKQERMTQDPAMLKMLFKATFETADLDKSGYLERDEIEMVMSSISPELREHQDISKDVEEIISILDQNKDGKISFSEFQVLIEQAFEILNSQQSDPKSDE